MSLSIYVLDRCFTLYLRMTAVSVMVGAEIKPKTTHKLLEDLLEYPQRENKLVLDLNRKKLHKNSQRSLGHQTSALNQEGG